VIADYNRVGKTVWEIQSKIELLAFLRIVKLQYDHNQFATDSE
jgi:hypothetical protein